MKNYLTLLALAIFLIIPKQKIMAQNNHPMKVSMVSIFVEDPATAFKHYTEVLGFEKVMFEPEHYIAIVKSPADPNGVTIMLEPTEPGGLEVAKTYKKTLYEKGIPCMVFSSENIQETVKELKSKGVEFKGEITKTDFGQQAMFDDSLGNYILLIQYN